jgi:hypothetical protein
MKAYLSYWRKSNCSGGHYSFPSEFVLNCHKLSIYNLKKHFNDITVLCDEESVDFFTEMGVKNVEIIYDNLDEKYKRVWSVTKLIAYLHACKKGDPFIHVDYDVFLWKNIPKRLLRADVFAQNYEKDSYSWYQVDKFLQHCVNPGHIGRVESKPSDAINVGIFGGNNLDFINEYAKNSIDIVFDEKNSDFLLNKNLFPYSWNLATIVEQYSLAVMCQMRNINCEMLFPRGWPIEEEAVAQNYTHLMGSKHSNGVDDKVSRIVKKLNL